MKTSKIKQLLGEPREWKSSYGEQMYTIGVELENGDKGGINSKSKDKFKVGDEINYNIEPAKTKDGTILEGKFKITVINDNKPFNKSGFGGNKEDNEMKIVTMSYSYSKDLVVAGKADISKFKELANNMADHMMSKYKELKGGQTTNS